MTTEELARQHVAAALNGDLLKTQHVQTLTPRVPSVLLPLPRSPVTAVTNVIVDGGTLDPSNYTFTPFALVRHDGEKWPTAKLQVAYATGWEDGSEPPEVKAAIQAVTDRLEATPDTNLQSEAADDIRRTYAEAGAVTTSEVNLLRRWRQP